MDLSSRPYRLKLLWRMVPLLSSDKVISGVEVFCNDHVIALNRTAGVIWQFCDGTHPIREIIECIQTLFPEIENEVLAADIKRFLRLADVRGLLVLDWKPLPD